MDIELMRNVFIFIGGLGLFLYGMNTMADGFQKSAGGRMKKLLGFLTKNRFLAVIVGALITAIIQSSSATTVMVVGFVNAGLMNLTQAVGVIMGANVGTTITAWIVSMGEWGEMFKPDFFAPLIVGVGVLITMFSKKQKMKEIGEILIGFSVLFIGLGFMSNGIEPYRDSKLFSDMFTTLGGNPLLGVLTGLVVTAIIQSSSASVGILQTLAMNGLVNYQAAIFVTLGQNIGTCVTALISSIGAKRQARRAAIIHVIFNVLGASVFGLIMFFYFRVNSELAHSHINSVSISIFHTVFNIANTLLLFPFAKQLVRISELLIKEEDAKADTDDTDATSNVRRALDERILENPSFAIDTVNKEVVYMGNIVRDNAKLAVDALLNNKQESIDTVLRAEDDIDRLEKMLTEYLVKIDSLSLTEEQHFLIKNLLYTVKDLERIGDHSENLVELAGIKMNANLAFSNEAMGELNEISSTVMLGLENAIEARKNGSAEAIRNVVRSEDAVDDMEEELREKHMARLTKGVCNLESGIVFLDTLTNLERISDHSLNIADYVKSEL